METVNEVLEMLKLIKNCISKLQIFIAAKCWKSKDNYGFGHVKFVISDDRDRGFRQVVHNKYKKSDAITRKKFENTSGSAS